MGPKRPTVSQCLITSISRDAVRQDQDEDIQMEGNEEEQEEEPQDSDPEVNVHAEQQECRVLGLGFGVSGVTLVWDFMRVEGTGLRA